MMTWLYRAILWMHPPAFRRRFSDEMLWIFEQPGAEGPARLILDGLVSLLRQWLLRSGIWKLPAALLGAWLTVMAGGAVQLRIPRKLYSVGLDSPEAFFLLSAVASLAVVSLTAILSVVWFRFSRRRGA